MHNDHGYIRSHYDHPLMPGQWVHSDRRQCPSAFLSSPQNPRMISAERQHHYASSTPRRRPPPTLHQHEQGHEDTPSSSTQRYTAISSSPGLSVDGICEEYHFSFKSGPLFRFQDSPSSFIPPRLLYRFTPNFHHMALISPTTCIILPDCYVYLGNTEACSDNS